MCTCVLTPKGDPEIAAAHRSRRRESKGDAPCSEELSSPPSRRPRARLLMKDRAAQAPVPRDRPGRESRTRDKARPLGIARAPRQGVVRLCGPRPSPLFMLLRG